MSSNSSDIFQLLKDERDALLTGDFGRLADLNHRKETMAAGLDRFEGQTLADLRRIAEQNQRLLSAAMAGIREVTTRLGTTRTLRRQFETYGQNGERKVQSTTSPNMTRRA